MQDQHKPDAGLLSRLSLTKFRPSLRQRRLAAMGTAAAIVVVGLGAFALLPPVRQIGPNIARRTRYWRRAACWSR